MVTHSIGSESTPVAVTGKNDCVVSLTGYMPKLFSEPHNSINIPSNLNMNEI